MKRNLIGQLLFYSTDWLAFGHFVIAIAFVGALRDPVRNRWLFDFGLIACVLVVPYAVVFGTKDELVVTFESRDPGPTPDGGTSDVPWLEARYDFVLQPA